MWTMKTNSPIPAATVVPVLTYPDVREAVARLSAGGHRRGRES
jgi:hypothetical protein